MNMLAVAAGGFVGAIARSSLALFIVNNTETIIPLATLTVNLLGGFGLAFFLTLAAKGLQLSPQVKTGIATGFFGSFTTFSTISLEAVHLLDYYGAFWWLAYEFINITGGLIAAFLGYFAAVKVTPVWNKQKAKGK